MQRLDLGEAEAFQYLRRRSLEAGRPLGETAARLLAAEQQWFGQADLSGCMHLLLDVLVRGRPSWPWSRTSRRFSRIHSSTCARNGTVSPFIGRRVSWGGVFEW